MGIPTVDTDDLARQVVEPGTPALEAIRNTFGPLSLNPDNSLNRPYLAEIVFQNPTARQQLENIIHPKIHAAWLHHLQQWESENHSCAAVIIPLLFEKQLAHHFHLTLCVACSTSTQFQRLTQRGWTPDQIHARIQAQLPTSTKMTLSDHVLWNDGPLPLLLLQLQRVLKQDLPNCPKSIP
ncbi:MAG: Dephospho-CoA kinase [Verrucomicrobiota bacterium]|jgi:dephospho-CoA kinase